MTAFGHFKDVHQAFARAGQAPLVAIENVTFDLAAGQLATLLGPSGCGKTTFLKIVAGLMAASRGTVQINGRDVTEPHPDFGIVFQQANLMPWRTVLNNVLFPMEILKRNDKAARARAIELLALVGLSTFHRARPHQLSGGMQQRVALCRALIHQPDLLLMDEPFGALDELTRLEMNDLLLRIRQETGASVLFVTHSISEAVYLADQVIVFSRRPARVSQQIPVSLPYPRNQAMRFTPAFTQAERAASEALGIVPHVEALAS